MALVTPSELPTSLPAFTAVFAQSPALATAASTLQMLANMGVQSSGFQDSLRASWIAESAAQLAEADAFFAAQPYLDGAAAGDADKAAFSNAFVSLGLLAIRDGSNANLWAWFDRCATLYGAGIESFHMAAMRRAGGQVDRKPISKLEAPKADAAKVKNDAAKALAAPKKKKALADKPKPAAAAKQADAPAAAAAAASPLDLSQEAARDRLWARLAELGVAAPRKEVDPDLTAKKPVGHSTHNLVVKDKKSKQMFMIAARQSAKIDLKAITKELKMKQLRMAGAKDTKPTTCVEAGCMTLLTLYSDVQAKIIAVVDETLLSGDAPLRMCAGCADALDHSQHMVVDITPAQLRVLLAESGHEVVTMAFPDAE
jgi:hypothetical protein